MIGGHAALSTQIAKAAGSPLQGYRPLRINLALHPLPLFQGDYLVGRVTLRELSAFDAIVFAAGNDVRHVPEGRNGDAHALPSNGEAVPRPAHPAGQAGPGVPSASRP